MLGKGAYATDDGPKEETNTLDMNTYVTGQACRLPGADNIKAFRSLLQGGRCAVTSVPQDRWNHDLFLHPQPGTKGKSYTFAAGVLDDIWGFDLSAFNLSPREASQMDPQQRLLMQVVFEALEDAQIAPASLAGQRVGVFVGASSMDHGSILGRDPSLVDAYLMTGNTLSLVANRISHAFDLCGPSYVVDTACSSSLVALDAARKALATGDIDTAIVGGVNLLLNPGSFVGFSAAHMLSQKGLCQSFSGTADGYVRAEGCAAVVLQRSGQVPRRARARLLDSEINADGFTRNVALPAEAGQFSLLSDLYERAEIERNDLSFIEAHGTGTLVGDPIEARALSRAVAQHRTAPLPIGSSKTNVGHLEPASGLVGLIKTLIAFEDRKLPASLHAETLNPHIDFGALNLVVASEALKLPERGPLMAGVSSFGFGGVNAHCIVQSVEAVAQDVGPSRQDRLVVTSAFCDDGLKQLAATYADQLDDPAAFEDGGLVDQMWAGRGLHHKRLAVLAEGPTDAKQALQAFAKGKNDPRIVHVDARPVGVPTVFVYSGNGAQYSGMCQLSLDTDPAYRRRFAQIDLAFVQIAGWSLFDCLKGVSETLSSVDIAQSLLFADQAAQTTSLADKGLKPAAVMGHSGGEIAAAHTSGALSLEQAVTLVAQRCALLRHIQGKGDMAALQAGAAEAEAVLAEFDHADPDFPIGIAAINSTRSVTLTGPKPELKRFGKWVRKTHRLACVQLDLDFPYHSVLLAPYKLPLYEALGEFEPSKAEVRYFSCTRGGEITGQDLSVGYWWDNLRQPVLFQSAIDSAAAAGFECFLEIGARPILANYISDSAKAAAGAVAVTHTLSKADPAGVNPMERAFARAALSGCAFDKDRYFSPPTGAAIDLPSYPWQNTPLRATDSPEIQRQLGTNDSYHPLLGVLIASNSGIWRRDLDEHVLPALADHKVGEAVLLPATAMAEMAFAAAHQVTNGAFVEITDLDLTAPVILSGGQGLEMQTTANTTTGQITLQSRARLTQDPLREHMRARFSVLSSAPIAPSDMAPLPISEAEDRGRFTYKVAASLGLNYGPAFQGAGAVRVDENTIEVTLLDGVALHKDQKHTGFDPVQMDCLLHGLIQAAKGTKFDRLGQGFVPIRVGRIQVFATGQALSSGRADVRQFGSKSMLVDVTGFNRDGQPVVCFHGLRLQASFLNTPIDFERHAYHVDARPILPSVTTLGDETLLKTLAEAASSEDAGDDSGLLIAAATHQAIWSALRDCTGEEGIYTIANQDQPAEYRFLGMLSQLNLAVEQEDTNQWRIAARCDLPASDEIAHSLLQERPDLIAELSVLLRLPEAVREVLAVRGGVQPEPETLFGREAMKGLATVHPQATQFLSVALNALVEAVPPENRVRIGVVGPDLTVLRMMTRAHPGLELVEIRSPTDVGQSNQSEFMSMAWDAAWGFDGIAFMTPTDLEAPDVDVWIQEALNTGGSVVLLNQNAPALAMAAQASAASALGQACDSRQMQQRFDEIFKSPMLRFALPNGVLGGDLLVGRLPIVEGEADPHLSANDDPWSAVWEALYGPCKTSQQGLQVLTPTQEIAPLLLHRPTGSQTTLEDSLLELKTLILRAAQEARPVFVVLPNGAQFHGSAPADPQQFALWCSLRTISNEYPDLKITAVDPCDVDDVRLLLRGLCAVMQSAPDETEIVLTPDSVLGLRIDVGLPQVSSIGLLGDTSLTLKCVESRRLNGLEWVPTMRAEPKASEVEVEIAATGLNYRDVMWALGLLPEEALENGFVGPTLGLECAGRVARVGAGVTKVAVGDHVIAFGPSSFGTHLVSDEAWITALPKEIPLVQAATLPVAYFTAQYALGYLARLEPGETVLIHGGAGGVGMAAIAVAQTIGARIIATAGSPVKQKLLAEMGVEHVLSSRDMSFARRVRDLTAGQGVDVVLNSLAGPAMEASLGLLRPYGRFLELGKQDYYTNTLVGLRALKDNISYHGIDVDRLLVDRPNIARDVLADLMAHVTDGQYPPLPMTVIKGADVAEAFRLMQRSGQVGKVVVIPPDIQTQSKTGSESDLNFIAKPDGWHVIAGGLGGLGLEWAEVLQQRGATRLALMSRTGIASAEAMARVEVLRKNGAEVHITTCDITDRTGVVAALDSLRALAPIASVYHAAMVLEDRAFADIDATLLEQVFPAKTRGTDNLDQATRGDDLQAFVVFTSLASLIGNVGQTAYVAANAYQEAVIKQRVAAGLPGLAVAFGAITDVGYVARDEALSKMLIQISGKIEFPSSMALRALNRLLALPAYGPSVTLTPMSWSNALGQLKVLRHPSHERLYRLAVTSAQRQNAETLRADLMELSFPKAVKRTIEFLKREIGSILRVSESSLSSTRSLGEYGMDSLMSVELGLAVQEAMGHDLPMPTLGDDPTIEGIATVLVKHVKASDADAISTQQVVATGQAAEAVKRAIQLEQSGGVAK